MNPFGAKIVEEEKTLFPFIPPSPIFGRYIINRSLGILSGSTRPLVDSKLDAPSCMHDGIVSVCAHCSSLWLFALWRPCGVLQTSMTVDGPTSWPSVPSV